MGGRIGGVAGRMTSGQQNGGWSGSGKSGGWGSDWGTGEQLGFGTKKQDDLAGKMSGNAGQQYTDTQGVLSGMKGAQDKYSSDMDNYYSDYQGKMAPVIGRWQDKNDQLMSQSENQGKDAHAAYTNTILPQMKDNMENAMSLKTAMDPNNSVASGVRNQYNTEAAGETNRGAANYGVLAGLGAQATQNAAGGGMPMTGAQLQATQGANMSQAGTAFANAQAQAAKLREQGIQRGQTQSNWAYDKGQQAGQDYQGAIGNDVNQQQGFRGEQSDISGAGFSVGSMMPTQNYNYNQGMAGAKLGFAGQQGNQQLAAIGQKYGVQNAALGMQANAAGASQAGKMGVMSSALGVAGAAVGKGGALGGGGGVGGAGASAMNGATPTGGGGAAPDNRGSTNTQGQSSDNSSNSPDSQGAPADQNGGSNNSTGGMAITDPNDPNQGRSYRPYSYGGGYGGGVSNQMASNGQSQPNYYR